jgi:hypothetical protein
MEYATNIDWDEAFEYLPGTVVEIKEKPGIFDTIAYYEPMMVPPVWLARDPQPRYPFELRIVSLKTAKVCPLEVDPVVTCSHSQ